VRFVVEAEIPERWAGRVANEALGTHVVERTGASLKCYAVAAADIEDRRDKWPSRANCWFEGGDLKDKP
jgi:hypothetical protein